MNKQHFLFLNGGISQKFTGIESAAFKRYRLFTEHLNIRPIYLCMYYDLDLHIHLKTLKASGKIPDDFCYVNLYEFFLRDCEIQRKLTPDLNRTLSTTTISHNGKKRLARVYNMETKLLSFVNFYDEEGQRYRMDKYDVQGFLSVSIMYAENGKRSSANYFRQDGSLALAWHYSEKNGEHKVRHIVLFDKSGVPTNSFTSEDQLYTYLLRYYLNSFSHQDQLNIFIDRHIRFAKHITDGSIAAKIKCLHIMHSLHFTDHDDKESKTHLGYLNDLKNFDGVITLTPEQTVDITQRFGDFGNVHCIPHPLDSLPTPVPYTQRKANRVVAVGRLSKEKQHDKMIHIFAKVVEKIPDAQLDIFGTGELKEELEKRITELGLEQNVHLKGFSTNINAEFETAQCSLLTSRYEGQPLVVLESLSCGCPVVSYDITYGPASMIEDGKNGFLLPKNDEAQFAERIIQILQNPHLAQTLSHHAYQKVTAFSPENIATLWANLVEKLTA